MFKVLILSLAIFAATTAYPGHIAANIYSYDTEYVAALAKVGEIVHSVPSAVSHQSQTVVHGQTHVLSDVVAPVATGAAPALVAARSVETAVPIAVLPPSEISYHGTPLLKSIAASNFLSYSVAPVAIYH